MKKPILKVADIIIWFLLVGVVISLMFFLGKKAPGETVRISWSGGELKLDLHTNQEIAVNGKEGEVLIEIDRGKVRIIDSPCPRKLCIQKGSISLVNESIICLPEGIKIEILGSDPLYDAVIR